MANGLEDVVKIAKISDGIPVDMLHASFNSLALYSVFKLADIAANSFGFHDLDIYNSREHFLYGGFVWTAAYRMAGGGLNGVRAAMRATTVVNFGWEGLERFIPKYNGESNLDIASDVAVFYLGGAVSHYLEKLKLNLENVKRETKKFVRKKSRQLNRSWNNRLSYLQELGVS